METISVRKKTVRIDGWRCYEEPVNAVCRANDTGDWSDSPCPTSVRKAELQLAKNVLIKNRIRFRTEICQSSNVFCKHVYLVVAESDRERGIELIRPLIQGAELLYLPE